VVVDCDVFGNLFIGGGFYVGVDFVEIGRMFVWFIEEYICWMGWFGLLV